MPFRLFKGKESLDDTEMETIKTRKTKPQQQKKSKARKKPLPPREPLPPIIEMESQSSTQENSDDCSGSCSIESIYTQGQTSFCSILSMEDPLLTRVGPGPMNSQSDKGSPISVPKSITISTVDESEHGEI